jgi:hypothetical protein
VLGFVSKPSTPKGQVQHVLEADEREEGEHGRLRHEQDAEPARAVLGTRWQLEQIGRAPVAEARPDHEHEAQRLDRRAEHVEPHALADAAQDDAAQEHQKADRGRVSGIPSKPASRLKFSAATRDWVAIEVRPEHITASPTM